MYLIDSNIVLGTWNIYPPAIFRTLWEQFADLIPNGDLYFHEEVKQELTSWSSEQSQWFNKHVPDNRVIKPTEAEVEKYVLVSKWAQFERTPKLKQKAVDDFLNVADSWLVACAMVNTATIVSNETSAVNSTARLKLPDAAAHFGVAYLAFLGFLEEKNLSF
ncbi:MAG: DUF4411 family protein [Corynebacterium sp.]|nr:DUF4411 family protein [Corynebacterium sp.]